MSLIPLRVTRTLKGGKQIEKDIFAVDGETSDGILTVGFVSDEMFPTKEELENIVCQGGDAEEDEDEDEGVEEGEEEEEGEARFIEEFVTKCEDNQCDVNLAWKEGRFGVPPVVVV
jgi:hypothetical protein